MRKIPYGRQSITEDDINAVIEVLKSDYLTQGPRIGELEAAIADYHGARHAVAFSNGTAALFAAYESIGICEGDEIVSSPITFVATTNGAVYCGGTPVFADLDPETNCIDIGQIESRITNNTKAIVPIAYAGYPVDLKRIRSIADQNNCSVIYDAAHAIGSLRNGSFGMEYVDAAILSFHPVKHIAAGEGGMVLTNRDDIYERLLLFRSHGITKDPALLHKHDGAWYYEMQSLGYNFRITDMQCALAASQFRRIRENLKRRHEIASVYESELEGVDFIHTPPSVGYGILDEDDSGAADTIHAYHLYTITVKDAADRKPLYEHLHSNGVLAQIHYVPVHLHPYYRERFGFAEGDCPCAEDFYQREISIPMFHSLSELDQEYVIDTIKAFRK